MKFVLAAAFLATPLIWIALPLPQGLTAPPVVSSLTLEDRNGLVLRSTRAGDGSLQRWLSLGEIDPDVLEAFVASEDHRFYEHRGVDVRAVARAVGQNLRARRVRSGASTITMQLARILRPSRRTLRGKLVQALWALRLEAHLSKQQILEQYLNRVPLGQGTTGVDAAAALYFNATAARLSLGQAALLAGLASAPSTDNPFVAAERARSRRSLVLDRVSRSPYAGADAVERARREPLVATRATPPFLAPHFTSRVLQSAPADTAAGVWRTSLDLPLQTALESEVRHTVRTLSERGVREAALVVLRNSTGELLAWVGSPDFWADSTGQVDMVVSARQPGSALKPFLYGLAFDRGYTPASVLPDIPRAYPTSTGPYQPRNYDRRFHGPVRAREALASSYNVPAVELANRLGAASLLRVLHDAGFRSLAHSADYYGLGLALGNGDVTLLELANAYRALAAGGVWTPVEWRTVSPAEGSALDRRFMSAGSAALVMDILADPTARIPGFGVETPFDFPFPAAVKTGTSHHFTDNWAVGVTGEFTVAVWVGNFDGQPMRGVSGVTGAGPLLHRAMLVTARRYAPGALPGPGFFGATRLRVCALSGLRAVDGCPDLDEWFLAGTAPQQSCDWHRDGVVVWPAEYVEWAAQNGQGDEGAATETAANTAAAKGAAGGQFQIVSPRRGDRYEIPPGIDSRYATIALRAATLRGDGAVRWFMDGRPLTTSRWSLIPGSHVVRAVTASGQVDETTFEVDNGAARP
ncbi:MAG TPA: penicillin-binding protein 1C [Gemmatimonadales bacterium]|nr:penicillin-binding protein 1C [Gemmatimonadales bacterium]